MATAKANINIGGKKIEFYHVSLHQRLDWHDNFEITVRAERVKGKGSTPIHRSMEYIRKSADIHITCGGNKLKYKGLITNVRADRTHAGKNLIIFSGHSPTFRLQGASVTTSYSEKSISGIVTDIFKQYPTNVLKGVVDPQYSGIIPYIVQYKETNYHFLSRIAAMYGEWFYYDGTSVIFGKLPDSSEKESSDTPKKESQEESGTSITLGTDLASFDFGISLRPSNFEYRYYNYETNEVLKNPTMSFKPKWLSNLGKKALDESSELFPQSPSPVWYEAKDEALIKHLAETRKASILSDITVLKGRGHNAGATIGNTLSVFTKEVKAGVSLPYPIGDFRVISASHELTAEKDYTNNFEAIPAKVPIPPLNKNVYKPEAESQIATVIDNYDKEGLGRVKVQFKWQTGQETTPLIRVLTNSAAGGRGMYFTPEEFDQVYVDFEQGNPDRPYVTGALFHGAAKPVWGHDTNDIKALTTRSGHTILLDDKEGGGSITISDANHNRIHLDTKNGNIEISAPSAITFRATDINLIAGNSVNVHADPGDNENGGTGTVNIQAKEDISIGSETKDISLKASDKNINIEGKENVNVASETKNIVLTASEEDVTINATSGKIDVKVKETSIKSKGKTKMVANAKFLITGNKVEINKG